MESPTFITKLDKALYVILGGLIKEDIDDTLQQKLLSIISVMLSNSHSQSRDMFVELLENTKVMDYILPVLQSQSNLFHGHAGPFAFRLLGIVARDENVFAMLQTNEKYVEVLNCVKNVCNGNVQNLNFSLKDAILNCLTNLISHKKGTNWVEENDCIQIGFTCLENDGSLYVQQAAIKLLALYLHNSLMYNTDVTKRLVKIILEGLETSSEQNDSTKNVSARFIAVLKTAVEHDPKECLLAKEPYHLLKFCQRMLVEKHDTINVEKLVDLIAILTCYESDQLISQAIVEEVVAYLKTCGRIDVGISFSATILSASWHGSVDDKALLTFMLAPVQIVAQNPCSGLEDIDMYETYLSDKTAGRKLFLLCLLSLTKLVPVLSTERRKEMVSLSRKLLTIAVNEENVKLHFLHIISFPKTHTAIVQLISCILNMKDENQCLLDEEEALDFLKTFISVIDSSIFSSNVLGDVIKSCFPLIFMWYKASISTNKEWDAIPQLCELGLALQKRCLDMRWEVIDSIFEMLKLLMTDVKESEACAVWFCAHRFHISAWDCVKNEANEALLRATAVQLLCTVLQVPFVKNQFIRDLSVNEADLVKNLLVLLRFDPDTFVRREVCNMLSSIVNELAVQSSNERALCNVFHYVVTKDLDWEVKVSCLRAWKKLSDRRLLNKVAIEESERSAPDAQNAVKMLCETGFGSALITALGDPDHMVQVEATKILKDIRKNLQDLGLVVPEVNNTSSKPDVTENIPELNTDASNTLMQTTLDVRDSVMESVLDMQTSECIEKVMHSLDDGEACYRDFESFAVQPIPIVNCEDFISKLGRIDAEGHTHNEGHTNSIYETNPESLLDDILSVAVDEFTNVKPLMDCY